MAKIKTEVKTSCKPRKQRLVANKLIVNNFLGFNGQERPF